MSGITTLEDIDALVADKTITEEQAADLAAALKAKASGGQTAASNASRQAGRNRQRQAEGSATVKLPTVMQPIKVGVGGKVYAVEGQSHYRKPDGSHGVRAIPVVMVKAGKSKGVSITPDLLKIIDAKRAEIDKMLSAAAETIAKLRAAGSTDSSEDDATDVEMLD